MSRQRVLIFNFLFCTSIAFSDINIYGKVSCESPSCDYIFKDSKIEIKIIDSGISKKRFSSKIDNNNYFSVKVKGNFKTGKITANIPDHKFKDYIDLTNLGRRINRDIVLKPKLSHKKTHKIVNEQLILKDIKISKSSKFSSDGKSFTNEVDSLYCHTKIRNKAKFPKQLKYKWYYENQLLSQSTITIPKKTRNHRSFSKKSILPNQTGHWWVVIESSEGVLGKKYFKIIEKLLTKKIDIVEHTKELKHEYGQSEYSKRLLANEKDRAKSRIDLETSIRQYATQKKKTTSNQKKNIKGDRKNQGNQPKTNIPSQKSISKSHVKNSNQDSYSLYRVPESLIFYNLVSHQEQIRHDCPSVNTCYEKIGKEYKKTSYEIKQIAFKGIVNNWKIP